VSPTSEGISVTACSPDIPLPRRPFGQDNQASFKDGILRVRIQIFSLRPLFPDRFLGVALGGGAFLVALRAICYGAVPISLVAPGDPMRDS
jgi:hypothetical protein